jgi:hypothetical protein
LYVRKLPVLPVHMALRELPAKRVDTMKPVSTPVQQELLVKLVATVAPLVLHPERPVASVELLVLLPVKLVDLAVPLVLLLEEPVAVVVLLVLLPEKVVDLVVLLAAKAADLEELPAKAAVDLVEPPLVKVAADLVVPPAEKAAADLAADSQSSSLPVYEVVLGAHNR